MHKLKNEIANVLKKYPGITSRMDLSVESPLVVELAHSVKSVISDEVIGGDEHCLVEHPLGGNVIDPVARARNEQRSKQRQILNDATGA